MNIREMLKDLGIDPEYRWRPFRAATQQKRERQAPAHNHNKGESKIRRRMAARSRRINLRHAKRGKRR